jgi:hypothetical protein
VKKARSIAPVSSSVIAVVAGRRSGSCNVTGIGCLIDYCHMAVYIIFMPFGNTL